MKALCGECGHREVEPRSAQGLRFPFRRMTSVPIEENLEIPTCGHCGAEWFDRDLAERLDAAIVAAGERVLSRLGREAIEALLPCITQQRLEQLLGLSPGYLSKVKRGKETPSPALVAGLALLASRPRRLHEVEKLWSSQVLPPRLAVDSIQVILPKDERGDADTWVM